MSGSSVKATGKPVFSRIKISRFASKDPPPAKIIPLSTISAASSGGVLSSAVFMVSTTAEIGSDKASLISSELISIVLGAPLIKSLPLTSKVFSSSNG